MRCRYEGPISACPTTFLVANMTCRNLRFRLWRFLRPEMARPRSRASKTSTIHPVNRSFEQTQGESIFTAGDANAVGI